MNNIITKLFGDMKFIKAPLDEKFNDKISLTALVAMQKDRGIGKDNKLAWHIPEDLKRYRALTLGNIVVMGRVTYQYLDKALKDKDDRYYVILTKSIQDTFISDDDSRYPIVITNDLDKGILAIRTNRENIIGEEVFVCGGAQIYKEYLHVGALRRFNKIMITQINKNVVKADSVFPKLEDLKEWDVEEYPSQKCEKSGLEFHFKTYLRNYSNLVY